MPFPLTITTPLLTAKFICRCDGPEPLNAHVEHNSLFSSYELLTARESPALREFVDAHLADQTLSTSLLFLEVNGFAATSVAFHSRDNAAAPTPFTPNLNPHFTFRSGHQGFTITLPHPRAPSPTRPTDPTRPQTPLRNLIRRGLSPGPQRAPTPQDG